ncbi:MAG: BrnT family toxin [Nitrospira sp.]|nr:BrnT family toxin [Nitrospira sp.]
MHIKFEWDPRKAESNLRKHGVSFDEAGSVFLERLALSGPDPDHAISELRYIPFGMSRLGRLLVVSHTYRADAIQIINARRTTRSERKLYEEG